MPDFTDLVMQIRNSGLPEREKAELEKRLIREGPSMDVDRAIEAAFNPPTSTPSLPPHKHTQTEPPPKVIYVEKKSPQGNLGSGLITLIIFGLIFYYGFLRPDYSSSTSSSIYKTSSPATRSVSIFVSANQLHKDYETNEVAADLKCKNKTVDVYGTVERVAKDILDTPYVTLETDGFLGVQCYFDKSQEQTLAQIYPGKM